MSFRALGVLLAALLPAASAQGAGGAPVPALGAAFLAGLVSFLSPCVLPLVPSYLSVLGGSGRLSRALGFVLGFSLAFVAFGASASALGSLLLGHRLLLTRLGGALAVFFGLVLLRAVRIPFLQRELRADLEGASRYGAVALGLAFGAGWTPCIGPILGAILSLAASTADVGRGVGLLAAYAAGLAVPFLLAALAWDRAAAGMRRAGRVVGVVEKVGGAVLVLAGLLLLTDRYTALSAALGRLTPPWLL